MFLRTLTAAAFSLIALPAHALCTGESYFDQIAPGDRQSIIRAAAETPFGQGILWNAQKGDTTITIVGTMHIYDDRLAGIYDQISDDIRTADLILLEATPAEEAQVENLVATQPQLLFITDGPTLPELLDEETWDQVAQAASARMIPPFLAAKMQPWYISMILAIPACAMAEMAAGVAGLDGMIMDGAAGANVPMQALEPFDTIFDIFMADPVEDQIEFLRMNLATPDLQEQMFVAMLNSYFDRETALLWEMSRLAMLQAPGMDADRANDIFAETETALLINRNRSWMGPITQAAQTHDDIVVAVGAAHLMGESGVLALLQNQGWTVTRRD